MTNKKQIESLLFSAVGVAAMFFLLAGIYLAGGVVKARVDLTREKLYTLSPGTKAILKKLDTPVEIRFYYSQSSKDMPVQLKTYASRVEDLLAEYKKVAPGNLIIKKFDPMPDTDAEESAALDGVQGQMVNVGEKIYLGVAISQLDSKVALPFLTPGRERLLEYDISRAISRVTTIEQPVVGVMSSLPVFGEMNPMMMRMGQGGQSEPWVFIHELRRDFAVREIRMNEEAIPSDLDLLVVVHPKGISENAQYAIDQYLLRGGKLMAFLDPLSVVESRSNPQMNPMQAAASGGSTLDKLLPAWGIQFDLNKVAADLNFETQINRQGRVEGAPAVLSLTGEGFNQDDVVTSQVDSLLIPFGGTFSGTPADGLTQTVLVKTTERSQMVERFMAEFAGEQIKKDFVPSGRELPLAIRVTGKFKTAFPNGKPGHIHGEEEEDDHDHGSAENGAHLAEGTAEGAVILVGDSDLLFDQFSVQVQNLFGQRLIMPVNGNLNLVQSMVEQLSGDSNLISVRSRATMNRPFTVVRQMQAEAEEGYRSKIRDLEQSLTETETRLNELQQQKEGQQRFVRSPEQEAEIVRFQQREAEVKRELREVRKNLRRDIDSLENRLKWINIAGMPILVTLSGISLAIWKRRKTAAK